MSINWIFGNSINHNLSNLHKCKNEPAMIELLKLIMAGYYLSLFDDWLQNNFICSGDGQHTILTFYDNRCSCWEAKFFEPFPFKANCGCGIIMITALIVDFKIPVLLVCHIETSLKMRKAMQEHFVVPTWLVFLLSA